MKKVFCAILALIFIALPTINVLADPSVSAPEPAFVGHAKTGAAEPEIEVVVVKQEPAKTEGVAFTLVEELPKTASAYQG